MKTEEKEFAEYLFSKLEKLPVDAMISINLPEGIVLWLNPMEISKLAKILNETK